MEESIYLTKLVALDPEHSHTLGRSNEQCGTLRVVTSPLAPTRMHIQWQSKSDKGRHEFDMSSVTRISFAASNNVISIDLASPVCLESAQGAQSRWSNNIGTIKLYGVTSLSAQLKMYLHNEVERIKARGAKKRGRDDDGEEDELRKKNKECEEYKRIIARWELEGCTDDFRANFYNPIVIQHGDLAREVSESKKTIWQTPYAVPLRSVGMLDPEVVRRSGISEDDVHYLYYHTVMSNTFSPNDQHFMQNLRARYPEELIDNIVSCHADVQQYSPAGHPASIPWNFEENREMGLSEMAKHACSKLTQLKDEVQQEREENVDLKEENVELKEENIELKEELAKATAQLQEMSTRLNGSHARRSRNNSAIVGREPDPPSPLGRAARACIIM